MIKIPLHQDPQLPVAAMAIIGGAYRQQLIDRATLAFTMVNLADAAGRKRMLSYTKSTVFGSFRPEFVAERLRAAFPRDQKPSELTAKQKRRAEAAEEFRNNFLATNAVSLTNYERSQWYANSRKLEDQVHYVGCRASLREDNKDLSA